MFTRRTWLKCVCIFSFVCGVIIPLSLFLLTNGYDDLDSNDLQFMASVRGFEGKLSSHERKPLDYAEPDAGQSEMHYQVQEMKQIVVSVRNELRELELEREQVREAVDRSRVTLSKVRRELGSAKSSLQESKEKLAKILRETKRVNQYDGQQAIKSPVVVVRLANEEPQGEGGVVSKKAEPILGEGTSVDCFDALCFDYSKCLLTSKFLVYVYNQHYPDTFGPSHPEVVDTLLHSLEHTHSLTTDPTLACVYVVVTGEALSRETLQQKLRSLSHWGDGSNHVVVDLPGKLVLDATGNRGALGRSITANSYSTSGERRQYNILIPPVTARTRGAGEPVWKDLPPLLPALRQVLFAFEGAAAAAAKAGEAGPPLGTHWINDRKLRTLKEAIAANTNDKVVISADCAGGVGGGGEGGGEEEGDFGEWSLCGTPQSRAQTLSRATFSLVIGSRTGSAGPATFTRLMEALRWGAVPVILGLGHLPLDSVIDWERAALLLPSTSLGELHYILRNIGTDSVLEYRKQGRFLWETYFSSPLALLESVVAVMRHRAKHPPPAAHQYTPTNLVSTPGENHVILSSEFLHNFTTDTTDLWNSPPGPFFMYPTTPFTPDPVSGSQYVDLDSRQAVNLPPHVLAAGGITGPFFEDYLLGNVPEEQFTVVVLTYDRNEVLVEALERLKDLDHLAKVVVVWNNPAPPPASVKWPDIGVPVDVSCVRGKTLLHAPVIILARWLVVMKMCLLCDADYIHKHLVVPGLQIPCQSEIQSGLPSDQSAQLHLKYDTLVTKD